MDNWQPESTTEEKAFERHECNRRHIWQQAAISILDATGDYDAAIKASDQLLKDFDLRFPEPVPWCE
jgi:hypothetical protein